MKNPFRRFLRAFGPGFVTGASDDDPSGIATYTQIGAQFGLGQLWFAFIGLPFMIAVQEMVARIGMVTGEGIAAVIRKRYPRYVLWIFLALILVANTINIGVDLGAMGDAAHLIAPGIPFVVWAVLFTVLILTLEIFITYATYVKFLKWFALSLVGYIGAAFIVTADWKTVLTHAFIPTIVVSRSFLLALFAVIGTTISPYLFIWQANEEVEEEIAQGRVTIEERRGATRPELKAMRTDVTIGMAFSQLITFFIITAAAATFHDRGIFDIRSTAQAARALEPIAGPFAAYLYALGIIGTGLLAVPVLSASASYAFAEAFQWSQGLYKKLREAHGFYGVITITSLLGLLINFTGVNIIKALVWTAIINGLLTPPLLAVILGIANDRAIMGKWVNGRLANLFGAGTCVLMTVGIVALLIL